MPKDKAKLKRYIKNAMLCKKRYQIANLNGRYDLRIREIDRDIRNAHKLLKAIQHF